MIDSEVDETLALLVEPNEGSKRETKQDLGRISVDVDFDKLFVR